MRFVSAATLLFIVTTTGAAAADGASAANAGDKAMAEALFRAAKDLQTSGKLPEACAKYAESHRLDPKPGTILNVATCHELEGRTATAWADYDEAATFAARAHQPDREKFARGKVDELAKKLSYVVFRFPEVTGLAVVLDGKALTTASAGTRVPIDPGEHEIAARAPGKTAWSSRVTIEPGAADRTVVVPPLADEAGAGPPPAAAPSAPDDARRSDDGAHDDRGSGGGTQRTVGWIALGVGAVGLGGGVFFGLRTLSEKSTVDDHCSGPRCDDTGLRANDDAKSAATLSTIAFIAGGALIATGVVLLVTAKKGKGGASAQGLSRALHGVW